MRLFIAIEPPPSLVEYLAELSASLPSRDALRITPPSHLHLTLNFIGETQEGDAITSLLDQVSSLVPPFLISPGGCGVFPERGHPRIIWCSLIPSTSFLCELHTLCEERLTPLGLPPDARPFTPHITLARVRRGMSPKGIKEWVAAHPPPPLSAEIGEISLVNSILGREGARYSRLATFPLRGPSSPPL